MMQQIDVMLFFGSTHRTLKDCFTKSFVMSLGLKLEPVLNRNLDLKGVNLLRKVLKLYADVKINSVYHSIKLLNTSHI